MDPVKIDANYLADPQDLKDLAAGIDMARAIGNSVALRPYTVREIAPGNLSAAEQDDFFRNALGTFWHQIAGNRWSDTNQVAVRLWRVSDGALQQELDGYGDDVWSVALSPDGQWLASSTEDNHIRLWRRTVNRPPR